MFAEQGRARTSHREIIGRQNSPRNNATSLSPTWKDIASPSLSPTKRSDGVKLSQPQEQQQLLSRGGGGAGASRTMAEGRRVMVAHEVAAAKHREKVRIEHVCKTHIHM